MLAALIIVPSLFALAALVVSSERVRPWLVTACAGIHTLIVVVAIATGPRTEEHLWLATDKLSTLVLALVSVVFLACAIYTPAYLERVREGSNRVFCASLLAFLAAVSLMITSYHLGVMWVALEASTLASAPLLYYRRNARSLEATWKFLLIGSVGIALALLGSFFLAYAAVRSGLASTLLFDDLIGEATRLSRPWLHAAFILLFVGYGTKMGLAPMHTWKPDAYGEAPGIVGTLLAGVTTSCAFLAIMRFHQICAVAGDAAFTRRIMLGFGLFSILVAATFMNRQRDYKRVLAYSSVEHMGILMLGVGLGGIGTFGALLHLVNNAFGKGVLFLSAGNLHRAYGSKVIDDVSGALRRVPISGALFLAGFLAITGTPPFGPFLSEFTIVNAAFGSGRFVVGGAFLALLALGFIGMASTVLAVVQGKPTDEAPSAERDAPLTVGPAIALLLALLVLGVWIPGPLARLLHEAAAFVEVRA